MSKGAETWPHQVELRLTPESFHAKLRDIEEWLRMWDIPYRIWSALGETGLLRIRFTDEKSARAFLFHNGGTLASGDDVQTVLVEDVVDEVEFQRLADKTGRKE